MYKLVFILFINLLHILQKKRREPNLKEFQYQVWTSVKRSENSSNKS